MLLSISENKDCYYMLYSIDKNRGTHGDSSFMLGRLLLSRENPMPLGMGSVKVLLQKVVVDMGSSAIFVRITASADRV